MWSSCTDVFATVSVVINCKICSQTLEQWTLTKKPQKVCISSQKQWKYLYLLYHIECCVSICTEIKMINIKIILLYKPVTDLDWFLMAKIGETHNFSLLQVLMVPITKMMVEYWVFNIAKHLLWVILKCTVTKGNTGISIGCRRAQKPPSLCVILKYTICNGN